MKLELGKKEKKRLLRSVVQESGTYAPVAPITNSVDDSLQKVSRKVFLFFLLFAIGLRFNVDSFLR
jgi:hypothetical protein